MVYHLACSDFRGKFLRYFLDFNYRIPSNNIRPLIQGQPYVWKRCTVEPHNSGKFGHPDFFRYCGVFRYLAGYPPYPKNHAMKIFFQYTWLCIFFLQNLSTLTTFKTPFLSRSCFLSVGKVDFQSHQFFLSWHCSS